MIPRAASSRRSSARSHVEMSSDSASATRVTPSWIHAWTRTWSGSIFSEGMQNGGKQEATGASAPSAATSRNALETKARAARTPDPGVHVDSMRNACYRGVRNEVERDDEPSRNDERKRNLQGLVSLAGAASRLPLEPRASVIPAGARG